MNSAFACERVLNTIQRVDINYTAHSVTRNTNEDSARLIILRVTIDFFVRKTRHVRNITGGPYLLYP